MSPFLRFLARWFVAGLGICGIARSSSAQAKTDPIVELPTVIVSDNRELPPPESWRYAEIPGFEILSNACVSAPSTSNK